MKLRYEKKHRMAEYKIGDFVLIKRESIEKKVLNKGFSTIYMGPYKIVEKIGRVSYKAEVHKKPGLVARISVHVKRLKPYLSRVVK
ncbi:hypothetical protein AYI70_g9233 [Smittium culicis]|uniref:Tf2-1-like SH3-like domain-containing protein n=1 Tax=Smittium culicis TaxID=133412 RepID=A0A1R1XCA1_9FUNG|nr:hypothetical protein AYI70_g9233 [Smittium culicis]